MSQSEINKLVEKQHLLEQKKLVDLKTHYQAFRPREPGEDKGIESEIHRKMFDCELMRSSVFLNSIDENDFEEQDYDDAYEKLLEIEEESMKKDEKAASATNMSPYSAISKSGCKNPPELHDRCLHKPETNFSEKKPG